MGEGEREEREWRRGRDCTRGRPAWRDLTCMAAMVADRRFGPQSKAWKKNKAQKHSKARKHSKVSAEPHMQFEKGKERHGVERRTMPLGRIRMQVAPDAS